MNAAPVFRAPLGGVDQLSQLEGGVGFDFNNSGAGFGDFEDDVFLGVVEPCFCRTVADLKLTAEAELTITLLAGLSPPLALVLVIEVIKDAGRAFGVPRHRHGVTASVIGDAQLLYPHILFRFIGGMLNRLFFPDLQDFSLDLYLRIHDLLELVSHRL